MFEGRYLMRTIIFVYYNNNDNNSGEIINNNNDNNNYNNYEMINRVGKHIYRGHL